MKNGFVTFGMTEPAFPIPENSVHSVFSVVFIFMLMELTEAQLVVKIEDDPASPEGYAGASKMDRMRGGRRHLEHRFRFPHLCSSVQSVVKNQGSSRKDAKTQRGSGRRPGVA
jgi:hypothetical protein